MGYGVYKSPVRLVIDTKVSMHNQEMNSWSYSFMKQYHACYYHVGVYESHMAWLKG